MEKSSFLHRNSVICGTAILCSLLALSGCGLHEIKKQTSLFDNSGTIKGKIEVVGKQKGSVIVLRFMEEDSIPVLQRSVKASGNGEYEFSTTIPGRYYIAAFVDINGDEKCQPEEYGNYYGAPAAIDLGDRQTVTIPTIKISGPFPKAAVSDQAVDRRLAAWKNIGQVVTLDDPRFTLENYAMGLWRPIDFLIKAEGGLFFLEEYRKNKIPVLFIHGVANGPTLWNEVVRDLDREHFQPWLFYYPSGLRLDTISDYLAQAVSRLQEEYKLSQLYVVAHSMGGLVARSFVKKYLERDPRDANILRLVVTVNSPMNGMAAAGAGVRQSPIVVPSWRDVDPGSEFLRDINDWKWPEKIPYHLIISYQDGESGDGVVSLQSQAQRKLQSEATRIYVFNDEHTRTINDKEFHATLNQILENRRKGK